MNTKNTKTYKMKTNLHYLKKRILFLCLVFLSLNYVAQSTLATYQFSDNLDADEPLQPALTYYNSSGAPVIPGPFLGVRYVTQYLIAGSRMLQTDDTGSYLQVKLDTSLLDNINVSFTGEMLRNLFGGRERGRLSLYVDYTGTGSNFESTLLNIDLDTNNGFLDIFDSKTDNINLKVAADNNPNLLIRIKAEGYSGVGSLQGEIRIDNLVITSKSPKINVSGYNTATTLQPIPENAPAATLYGTDFGIVITDDPNAATKTYRITNGGSANLVISSITFSGANAADFITVPDPASPAPVPVPTNPINSFPATIAKDSYGEFIVRFNPSADGRRTAVLNINSNAKPNVYSYFVEGRGATCATTDLALRRNTMEASQPGLELLAASLISGSFNKISGKNGKNGHETPSTPFNSTRLFDHTINTGVNLYSSSNTSWYVRNETSEVEFGPVNIADENGVYISFNLAAFSSAATTTFLDTDFVQVEVYNPLTTQWSPVLKILGNNSLNNLGDADSRYSFLGVDGLTATAEYDGDLTPTPFYNATGIAKKYSKVKVKIQGTSNIEILKFRIIAKNNSDQKLWLIDDVAVYSAAPVTRKWSASGQWLNRKGDPDTVPNKNITTEIDYDYSTATNGNFTACDCTVNAGKSLTINTNGIVTLQTKLENSGNVTVESDASLIQKEDDAINAGDILVKRNLTFRTNERKEYNYLISPVENANLKTDMYRKSDGTPVIAPYVLYHVESNNKFYNSSGAYIAGRSLAVKEPEYTSGAVTTAFFTGKPFNGKINYPLAYSSALLGYNLVGNPYPSNIDLLLLYGDNSTEVESTFRFWDNTVNDTDEQQGSGYTGDAYAIFNAASGVNGTGLPAPGSTAPGDEGTKVPNKIVKVGQGFMVKSKGADKVLKYSNHIRLGDNTGSEFFGKQSPDDRYWLTMKAPSGIFSTIAMVYFRAGNNSFAADDSKATLISDVLYSIVQDEKVSINGRSSFADTDIIPLGTKHFVNGEYTIALGNKEGIFANGQNIYLKDTQTGIITNLSEGSYTFEANQGENTGRFEIIYQPETVLVTDQKIKSTVEVYRDNDQFVVRSPKNIAEVEVYDLSGKMITVLKGNNRQVILDASFLNKGMYVLRIKMTDGEITNKKILK